MSSTSNEHKRRERVAKQVSDSLKSFEKEIESEIEKVRNSETKLRNEQIDYYLLYLNDTLGGFHKEIKDHTKKIDKLMQELEETGKKKLKEKGLLPTNAKTEKSKDNSEKR